MDVKTLFFFVEFQYANYRMKIKFVFEKKKKKVRICGSGVEIVMSWKSLFVPVRFKFSLPFHAILIDHNLSRSGLRDGSYAISTEELTAYLSGELLISQRWLV
jgi:hypothetical protein